jgi:hypothetical protein
VVSFIVQLCKAKSLQGNVFSRPLRTRDAALPMPPANVAPYKPAIGRRAYALISLR